MKIIALVPVRNEAWVLEHSLACWSGFCDVVIVNDQMSTDSTREICRRFPKVVLLETTSTGRQTRWPGSPSRRGGGCSMPRASYDGNNLLWCTDADELTPPTLARAFFEQHAEELAPGRVIECRFYNLWNSLDEVPQDLSVYGPRWKPMGFVDDRIVDYPRGAVRPLHEPRMPIEPGETALRAEALPVLHLQWTMWQRNQMKQAWYRCIDFMDKRMTAAEVNAFYSITLPESYVHTEDLPDDLASGYHAA